MQLKLLLKLLIIISFKLLIKTTNTCKSQNSLYFQKNYTHNALLLLKNNITTFNNPEYLQFFNIVLPFFSQLFKNNYTIFFNNFSSYTKKNNLFIKKTQKRITTTKQQNNFFFKYKKISRFYKISLNFWNTKHQNKLHTNTATKKLIKSSFTLNAYNYLVRKNQQASGFYINWGNKTQIQKLQGMSRLAGQYNILLRYRFLAKTYKTRVNLATRYGKIRYQLAKTWRIEKEAYPSLIKKTNPNLLNKYYWLQRLITNSSKITATFKQTATALFWNIQPLEIFKKTIQSKFAVLSKAKTLRLKTLKAQKESNVKKPNLLELMRMRKKELAELKRIHEMQTNIKQTTKIKYLKASSLYSLFNKFIFYSTDLLKKKKNTTSSVFPHINLQITPFAKSQKKVMFKRTPLSFFYKSILNFKPFKLVFLKRLKMFLNNKSKNITKQNPKLNNFTSFGFYTSGLVASPFFTRQLILKLIGRDQSIKINLQSTYKVFVKKNKLHSYLKQKKNLLDVKKLYSAFFFILKKKQLTKKLPNAFLRASGLPNVYFKQKTLNIGKLFKLTYLKKKKQIKKILRRLKRAKLIYKSKFVKYRRKKVTLFSRKFIRFGKKTWNSYIPEYRPTLWRRKTQFSFKLKNALIKSLNRLHSTQNAINTTVLEQLNYVGSKTIARSILHSAASLTTTAIQPAVLEKKYKSKFYNLKVERTGFFKKKYFFLKKKLQYVNANTLIDAGVAVGNSKSQTKLPMNLLYTENSQTTALILNKRPTSMVLNLKNQLRLLKLSAKTLLQSFAKKHNISIYNTHQANIGARRLEVLPLTIQTSKHQSKLLKLKQQVEILQPVIIATKLPYKNKNIFLQKKLNKNLHKNRYLFLNFFIFFQKTQRQRLSDLEMYQINRVQRRFWPVKTINKLNKFYSFTNKKKENFLQSLKNQYLHLQAPSLGQFLKTTVQSKSSLRSTKQIVLNAQKNTYSGFTSHTSSFDVAKKFIQILWKAQKYHNHVFQKQNLCNRWRFKRKFWSWYKQANRTQSLRFTPAEHSLPLLFNLFFEFGFFFTKKILTRLLKYNIALLNGKKILPEYSRLNVGDVVQLSPSLGMLNTLFNNQKQTTLEQLKKFKNINRVITQSQWRQRKGRKKDIYFNFTEASKKLVPSWIQFDFFASVFSAIKQPTSLRGATRLKTSRYMLDKLTPWRLKI